MKNLKNIALAVTCLLLANCAENNNKYIKIDENYAQKQSKNLRINYVPNINIVTKDTKLLNLVKNSTNKKFRITEKNFAVLNLFLESSLELDPLEKQQPKLIGILKKHQNKYNYKLNYKLVDSIGSTITQGSILGLSEEKTETIANAKSKASRTSVQDAATQLVKKLNNEIKNVLIDFKIVSVSSQSVFININDGISLNKEEIFLVNELPNTALSLQGIVQSNDLTLAELKVLTGQFPKVGMTVNLQK